MCGVIAVWNRDHAPVDRAALQRGLTAMRHRGPDDEGYVLIDTATGRSVACRGRETRSDLPLPALDGAGEGRFDLALGHRRLAILDLSRSGHQPMSVGGGATWISFNGMIYNHAEIRLRLEQAGHRFESRSDTEVVLRAYDQWGTECVQHFNGMWTFVLWDGRERRLFVSRDRLGIKPLVYHVGETVAVFGSELKALTAFSSVPRAIDAEALHHYLSLMEVPAPFTIYERTRKLLPGHSLLVDVRSCNDTTYWTLAPKPRAGGGDDALEELGDLLRDSVRLRLAGDVPAGTLLSGGVDSSIVTAMAASLMPRASLPTYNLAVPDFAEGDESPWAERVAAHLSTDHHRVPMPAEAFRVLPRLIESFDEPFAVSSVIGVHRLAAEASQRVKILLTGDGGDELFAGYRHRYERVDAHWDAIAAGGQLGGASANEAGRSVRWNRAGPQAGTARPSALSAEDGRDTSFSLRKMILNDAEKSALYTEDWRERTRGLGTVDWLRSLMGPRDGERLRRWQLLDIGTSLPNQMLSKVDKATMACGVEARVPLLDHRIAELAIALPATAKIRDGENKWILKKLGESCLPREVLYREKHGFDVPLSLWLRGAGQGFVRDTLSASALRRVGVLQPRAVEQVIAYHESEPGYAASHMLFTLVCLQLWHDVCHRPVG